MINSVYPFFFFLSDRKRCHSVYRKGRSGYLGGSWEVRIAKQQPLVTLHHWCCLKRLLWKQFPDSDVSIYLDHFQRDRMDWKHENSSVPLTGAHSTWGNGYWVASDSCSADFCPLETDLCPVNMLLRFHSEDLNYGLRGERLAFHPLSHLAFSFEGRLILKKLLTFSDLSHQIIFIFFRL